MTFEVGVRALRGISDLSAAQILGETHTATLIASSIAVVNLLVHVRDVALNRSKIVPSYVARWLTVTTGTGLVASREGLSRKSLHCL